MGWSELRIIDNRKSQTLENRLKSSRADADIELREENRGLRSMAFLKPQECDLNKHMGRMLGGNYFV